MHYLTHIGVSLVASLLYFLLQYDYNNKFKNQKSLVYMTGGVFIFVLFICFIVISSSKQVSFGDNEVQEFDDDDGSEGSDDGSEGSDGSDIRGGEMEGLPGLHELQGGLPPIPAAAIPAAAVVNSVPIPEINPIS